MTQFLICHLEFTAFYGHNQSELGAQYSYRDSENLINRFSSKKRRINNHEKIHKTSEDVGESLSKLHQVEEDILVSEFADELIIHVDGGHHSTP